ncbi:aldose 1-epimerase family protein [Adhaeribacter aquaticus]|uniref:aldose 1-epimerase family protein n=1 Tax=Adhaeribacter aquaticus TaxID=299567 RepID=UPI0003FBD6B5|nr:aldose 1-epimerase family protein [Adhaeribacter aquaticus]
MIHYLENEHFKIGVKESGAELCSFINKTTNLEYIWQADPAIWPRHAPVLFPIVGKVPANKFGFEGETYSMSQHGFARDQDFSLKSTSKTALSFELISTPDTLALYPFSFRLEINYTLNGNCLDINYRVENSGEKEMYFSIGAHPGFTCPLLPDEQFNDYYLEFEHPETQSRELLTDGLRNGEMEPVLKESAELPLNYEIFEKDAIVLKGLKSERISLKSRNHSHGLDFEFKNYPYFGIWTKEKDAPFICLEPWHGVASRLTDSGELTQKEGILKLESQGKFTCSYQIKVY